jgi:tetratricopeptide (TPR) repeat protein
MIFKCVVTLVLSLVCLSFAVGLGVFGPFVIVFLGIVLSVMWTPHLGEWLARPITGLFDGGNQEVDPHPFYSIAIAKRKLGKSTEAILEIHKQLERFPTDFEGQMLIAGIQAEDQKDLPGADISIQRICNQAGHPPRSVAYALTSLADWHLKIAQDNEAARGALEKIIEKFPGTEFALQASQRLAHLGSTEHLLAPYDRKKFAVAEGVEDMGLIVSGLQPHAPEIPPEQQAADFVKQLELHPLDMEVREKLAMLYARHYRRLELAADQLEQMIQTPNQPPKLVAHWLNLLADFQIQLAGNYAAARTALERIVELDPDVAAAQVAQRRIEYLKLELKGQKESQATKLGSYEDDIGLKADLPR